LSVKMAGISERIAPIDVTGMRYHTRTVDLIQCNWKVYADNYLEGYHIPIVHPELAKLLDYSQYVTEVSEHYSLQYSPFADAGGDNPYRAENGEAWY
jgi:choline monooxygenase